MGWFFTGIWSTLLVAGWIVALCYNCTPAIFWTTVLMVITAFCMGVSMKEEGWIK